MEACLFCGESSYGLVLTLWLVDLPDEVAVQQGLSPPPRLRRPGCGCVSTVCIRVRPMPAITGWLCGGQAIIPTGGRYILPSYTVLRVRHSRVQ